ncbi:MAG: ribonuclease HII [Aigarchaeota archaeon]|nr:ribonuclease HII [Aigarchaeota archaeon]
MAYSALDESAVAEFGGEYAVNGLRASLGCRRSRRRRQIKRETIVAGVDEAGRGPVIGPLAIAGIAIEGEVLPSLSEIGVKDSKKLSPRAREELYAKIAELAKSVEVVLVQPKEIDRVVGGPKHRCLNYLEAVKVASVLEELHPDIAYVDASDVNTKWYAQTIQKNLSFPLKLVCRHKADARYPVVSAASIVAKVSRDRAVARLKMKYGDFGSGYPSDPHTRAFLRNWMERRESLPPIVRKKWKTLKRVSQTTLSQ